MGWGRIGTENRQEQSRDYIRNSFSQDDLKSHFDEGSQNGNRIS